MCMSLQTFQKYDYTEDDHDNIGYQIAKQISHSDALSDWKHVSRGLGLPEYHIQAIVHDCPGLIEQCEEAMMRCWQRLGHCGDDRVNIETVIEVLRLEQLNAIAGM